MGIAGAWVHAGVGVHAGYGVHAGVWVHGHGHGHSRSRSFARTRVVRQGIKRKSAGHADASQIALYLCEIIDVLKPKFHCIAVIVSMAVRRARKFEFFYLLPYLEIGTQLCMYTR